MDTTNLTKPEILSQQLQSAGNPYKLAFEQDKPFAFIKVLQRRIKRIEQQAKSVFKH